VGGEQHAVDVESFVLKEHLRESGFHAERAAKADSVDVEDDRHRAGGVEVVDLGAGQHALVIADGDLA
jgi:hypothetical protein